MWRFNTTLRRYFSHQPANFSIISKISPRYLYGDSSTTIWSKPSLTWSSPISAMFLMSASVMYERKCSMSPTVIFMRHSSGRTLKRL